MMRTELLKGRFDSLEDYEKFAAEWTEVCCMVNQNSRNMGNRERFKKIRNWNGCRVGECPKCGGILRSYMRFCDECGQRLDFGGLDEI